MQVEQIDQMHQKYADRFWSKVEKHGPEECWIWQAGMGSTNNAYGRFWVSKSNVRPAHQVAWELDKGLPFPKGMVACHSCDNPSCVNPAHIWPGTQSDNIKDCIRKGRNPSKPRSHCRKGHALTPDNRTKNSRRCLTCARENSKLSMRKYRAQRGSL